ncbi:MBL fold metallo-hydrolase [Congregibacter variabilis]|uniref:MBL fold metallo-hydrolase n=1 Tax=Congregibacter variabilis TaxID=3081200 RepID=A0ABZ0I5M1_9GAMM|nr:MBL fold metallo-hydrolase [Congregibacter sp. IMCC43200]
MANRAEVTHFFDEPTNTLSYVVKDPDSSACAIVDSVLNLDYPSGTISYEGADRIIAYINDNKLSVDWILETHVHADHLSAAPYLQQRIGGKIAIGSAITTVQSVFAEVFNEDDGFLRDGSQFDVLLNDGDALKIGSLEGYAMHTPGHTPACMTYVFGDAVFVGDTLFMPDYGTARCDFPGGDASTLFRSIQRILALPRETRIFVCHDYMPNDRELAFETSVGAEIDANVHVRAGINEGEFVSMREARDKTLGMPNLILPSLQVNMRAGHVPPPESGERFFLKLPLNAFGGPDLSDLAAKE